MNDSVIGKNLNLRTMTGLVILLYVAHALPLYFFNVALPAIMRQQGMDLRWIGMLRYGRDSCEIYKNTI